MESNINNDIMTMTPVCRVAGAGCR